MKRRGTPTNTKGMCRVCHHRGDEHYDDEPDRRHPYFPEIRMVRSYCHHSQAGGVCGCVGRKAGAQGDAKRTRT